MDASVQAQGFTPWGGTRPTILNTTFYAEYNSTGAYYTSPILLDIKTNDSGAGFNASKRLSAEHLLTSSEASAFTVEKVFGGKPAWIDWSYQP